MNEHLLERFRGMPRGQAHDNRCHDQIWPLGPKLNTRIREYYEGVTPDGGSWLLRPEVPSSEELMDTDTLGGSAATSQVVMLSPNQPEGAFDSKEHYLSTQYELLREDSVKPLRDAVSRVREKPNAVEAVFDDPIGIYDKVHICGFTPSTRGIAIRITFSLSRTEKKILWEQSKRLVTGSLVVLTPKEDMFQKTAIVATVAARPLEAVKQNPPEIDLFFARTTQLEIDPAAEYVMIEERSSFFEADRYTLLGLQQMMRESFPLSEHLVQVSRDLSNPPKHVRDCPKKDLRSVFLEEEHESHDNVNILTSWPVMPQSELDGSQLRALKSILTKRMAIVQGPPGTGKTFVSVQAIKIMLANYREGDPPIIIACQTNHAVDQILRHVANFEKKFVRLGGRSKDRDVIKKRTLYEVRQATSENPPPGWSAGMAKKKMTLLEKEIRALLAPLQDDNKPLNHRCLEDYKLLTKKQADSLESGASRWVQDSKTLVIEARSPFTVWLGPKLVPVPPKQLPEEFGFEFEEADLEFEQLKDAEAEISAKDDEDFETLRGEMRSLADNFTCHKVPGMGAKAKYLLMTEQDMWRIPENSRPGIYCYLQAEQKAHLLAQFREKAHEYDKQALKRKIGYWEKDENILKQQRVIGMTTTGFSKYRALISALRPTIVLIEEAAETLEAPTAVTCIPSLQQLILVGDHQQLRPHTHVRAHERAPFFLDVSLFERMINNKLPYDVLSQQRRMIPEIRRILYPIYKNKITDHPSVRDPTNRPDVPGMGGINSLFFSHRWAEQRDDQWSCYNRTEAEMIVGFFAYLLHNGMEGDDITILTFYNGQRKSILNELRNRFPLLGKRTSFKVVTVDSYQGEENKVVILSLVRSNTNGQIGFLGVDNRVCVSLSRAQCGFYIFGNGELLFEHSNTWKDVIQIMAGSLGKKRDAPATKRVRLLEQFPVTCSKHKRTVEVVSPRDWDDLVGGCNIACGGVLPCGHACELRCHPFSHENVNCQKCLSTNKANQCTKLCPATSVPGRKARSQASNTASTSSSDSQSTGTIGASSSSISTRKRYTETYKFPQPAPALQRAEAFIKEEEDLIDFDP